MGRFPGCIRESRRAAGALVAKWPPAAAVLPRAAAAARGAAAGPAWGIDPPARSWMCRPERRARLRRNADAPPPGRVESPPARRRDPGRFVAFDVLLWAGEPKWEWPLGERRAELERVADGFRLTPSTPALAEARGWLERVRVARPRRSRRRAQPPAFLPGSREGIVKVKEHKSADCVVVGLRWKGSREKIASVLLGLYGEGGELDYVGSCAVAAKTQPGSGGAPAAAGRGRSRLERLGAEPLGRRPS